MSTNKEFEAANVLLPVINKPSDPRGAKTRIAAIPITSASTAFNFATYFPNCYGQGHFFSLVADGGDVYFAFSDASGDTVDNTVTTAAAATLCQKLPSGSRWDGCLPDGYTYLIAKTSAGTATLRVSVSSVASGQSVSQGNL